MTLPTEAVTLAGSGLTFINDYDSTVTAAYRTAIIAAENFLQAHFTNQLTVSVDFSYSPLSAGSSAENNFTEVDVSYASFVAALRAHATTSDNQIALANLPATDPSGGKGFALPEAYATMLGLQAQTNDTNDSVTLNSSLNFTFGQDAIGALEHELTEGVFGRTASLGFAETKWNPLDLFRYTAAGVRDFTGGEDGVTTFFGFSPSNVSTLPFHNSVNSVGHFDGQDLGDWAASVFGDAFGPGGPGDPGTVSTTDLQELNVLGWDPSSATGPFIPAAEQFANSLTDTSHPFGQLTVGSSLAGSLPAAGDHQWYKVTLQAGVSYTITETGHTGGGGTLADPLLQLHDSGGNVVASNDDIVDGTDPDSRIVFTATTSGTYYVDAGAFADGYAGSYTVAVTQTGGQASPPTNGMVLMGTSTGDDSLVGGSGDDTITGGSIHSVLRGGQGDDSIQGGSGFNDMNGNQGNDTIHGGVGSNWVVGGQGDDSLVGGGGFEDIVLGNLGNDTLRAGTQADILRGGQGDDVIFGGPGNDFISGDLGHDTETGGTGADIFHGSASINVNEITNFDYAKGDRVELDPGTQFTTSQIGANTVVQVQGGGEMILMNVQLSTLPSDWIFEGTLTHL